MLGAEAPLHLVDEVMDGLVETLPIVEKILFYSPFGLAEIEVNIAVTHMAKGTHPPAGDDACDQVRGLFDELRYGRYGDRDIVFDGPAFPFLRFGDRFAQRPNSIGLGAA